MLLLCYCNRRSTDLSELNQVLCSDLNIALFGGALNAEAAPSLRALNKGNCPLCRALNALGLTDL